MLTDLTGEAASGNKTSPMGVQAGTVLAARDGYTIKYVVADTGTSPSQALTAAQKLVEQDHVFAVVAVSSLTFSASSYLTAQGIPVVGVAEDGPEWITAKNMFSVFQVRWTSPRWQTTVGDFFKKEGATNIGALGYSISPSSAESTKAAGLSAPGRRPEVGVHQRQLPVPAGSTKNVEPVALLGHEVGQGERESPPPSIPTPATR